MNMNTYFMESIITLFVELIIIVFLESDLLLGDNIHNGKFWQKPNYVYLILCFKKNHNKFWYKRVSMQTLSYLSTYVLIIKHSKSAF